MITNTENKKIQIDGILLPHKIGDKAYYVTCGSKWCRPFVRYIKIEKIVIEVDGITYYDADEGLINFNEQEFFSTVENAEKWIAENVPKEYSYKAGDELFVIENNRIVPVTAPEYDGITFWNGEFQYVFYDAFYHGYKLVYKNGEFTMFDSCGQKREYFASYQEAKAHLE